MITPQPHRYQTYVQKVFLCLLHQVMCLGNGEILKRHITKITDPNVNGPRSQAMCFQPGQSSPEFVRGKTCSRGSSQRWET